MGTNPNIPIPDEVLIPVQPAEAVDDAPAISVEDMLISLTQHASTNAAIYDLIYEKVDESRFNQLLSRAENVKNAVRPANSKHKPGAWRTRQNVLRGKLFEQIVGLFFRASKPFQAYNRVISPTNEMDWLDIWSTTKHHPVLPRVGTTLRL